MVMFAPLINLRKSSMRIVITNQYYITLHNIIVDPINIKHGTSHCNTSFVNILRLMFIFLCQLYHTRSTIEFTKRRFPYIYIYFCKIIGDRIRECKQSHASDRSHVINDRCSFVPPYEIVEVMCGMHRHVHTDEIQQLAVMID